MLGCCCCYCHHDLITMTTATAFTAAIQHDHTSQQPLLLLGLTIHLDYPASTQKHFNFNTTQLQNFIVDNAITSANTNLIISMPPSYKPSSLSAASPWQIQLCKQATPTLQAATPTLQPIDSNYTSSNSNSTTKRL